MRERLQEMKPGFESPLEWKDGGGDGEASGVASGGTASDFSARQGEKQKPPFRIAQDDSKPLLRDPILRSDPIETEQAVLRLPPFSRGDV
ncbi:hypothetical protein Cni_G15366 [Canna indica]|uniref:Uncharacterized protein n=1 Tax=Canna indica TaxID=4628 RepID=A0AAQ3KHS1_9LILI|nr:hypothetical protein Cni_G15366 [Canna indica]